MLNFSDFIQVFVFTRNHHLNQTKLIPPPPPHTHTHKKMKLRMKNSPNASWSGGTIVLSNVLPQELKVSSLSHFRIRHSGIRNYMKWFLYFYFDILGALKGQTSGACGLTVLAVDAGVVWTFFFLSYIISLFFFPLPEERSNINSNTVSKGQPTIRTHQRQNTPIAAKLTALCGSDSTQFAYAV